MHGILKALLSAAVGLAAGWVCLTPLNLDQTIGTVIAVFVALGVYKLLDKIPAKE